MPLRNLIYDVKLLNPVSVGHELDSWSMSGAERPLASDGRPMAISAHAVTVSCKSIGVSP